MTLKSSDKKGFKLTKEQQNFLNLCIRLLRQHECEKSDGKIVAIARDNVGNLYCGYCGKKYDCFENNKNKQIDSNSK